jgi:hypothetical protein
MHVTEFIPSGWLERSAWTGAHGAPLYVFSRPCAIERRQHTRRHADVELLLKTLYSPKAA